MFRNLESSFAQLPHIDIERSRFDRSSGHITTFNVGDLIPFFWDEVLPGDTFNVTTSMVARLQTLLTPIFGNIYIDTYYFYVPMRICWNHAKEFFGENTDSAWLPENTYPKPQISSPVGGWNVGTIADYMGVPTGVDFNSDIGLTLDALPFRAYALICDQWFRDQNLTDPLYIDLGDSNAEGSNGDTYVTDVALGGAPFKASKFHDYFTSALPAPQKGPSVPLVTKEFAVVSTGPNSHNHFPNANGEAGSWNAFRTEWVGTEFVNKDARLMAYVNEGQNIVRNVPYGDSPSLTYNFVPSNLYADLGSAVINDINQLRLAFQLQKFYEKQARAGSRYRETILEMFGVSSPDSRMMIPEYLGGHRFPLQIHQIANTAQSSAADLGDLGAMSNTSDIHDDFVKSFTEHGYVIGVMVARYDKLYPQGLAREWTRKDRMDYYWPVFANIGEQPIYKYEINAEAYVPDGEESKDYSERLKVFGYQEAYASYRFKQSRVSSLMRPGVSGTLASWHLADHYSAPVSLSDAWIREDKTNVDRTLAVTSLLSDQIFADIWIKNEVVRAMPMFSIPGLIDHH